MADNPSKTYCPVCERQIKTNARGLLSGFGTTRTLLRSATPTLAGRRTKCTSSDRSNHLARRLVREARLRARYYFRCAQVSIGKQDGRDRQLKVNGTIRRHQRRHTQGEYLFGGNGASFGAKVRQHDTDLMITHPRDNIAGSETFAHFFEHFLKQRFDCVVAE